MKKYILELVVFTTGAVVMILELVGSRIIAPYAGTSIVVWTSLIGIILGSLSIGYTLGGKLADTKASFKTLGNILLTSSILVGLINVVKPIIIIAVQNIADIRVSSLVLTLLLFAPASVVLGMIPTYCVRLKLTSIKGSGRTVGNVYAISTLGSITGTFLAGFVLIALLGSSRIVLILAVILAGLSLVTFVPNWSRKAFVLLVVIVANFTFANFSLYDSHYLIADIESNYNKILVLDYHNDSGKAVRSLVTGRMWGPAAVQTQIYKDSDELATAYAKFFRLAESATNPNRILVLGGGGFAYPMDVLTRRPDSRVDVVELDPKLTEVAKHYFRLKQHTNLNIYHTDARVYINSTDSEYDLVFVDVFTGDTIPFHLTTYEAMQRIYTILDRDGVMAMNVIASADSASAKMITSEIKTIKTLFPYVYVFPVQNPDDRQTVQNFVIIAAKKNVATRLANSDDVSGELWHYLREINSESGSILSDDWAPVDQYYIAVETKLMEDYLGN